MCIHADPVSLCQNFRDWLQAEIPGSESIAIDHVICADDAGSDATARLATEIIESSKGARSKIIGYRELAADSLSTAKRVHAVTAVAGSGGLLREMSRDLREFVSPTLPRNFLLGIGLPQTREVWERFLCHFPRMVTTTGVYHEKERPAFLSRNRLNFERITRTEKPCTSNAPRHSNLPKSATCSA